MAQEWKYREHLGKQGKFRVGDLVQMSSYGKSTSQNYNVRFDGDEIGLITEIHFSHAKYPIKVHWMNRVGESIASRFFFRELIRKRT
jgi:hypothetical protein